MNNSEQPKAATNEPSNIRTKISGKRRMLVKGAIGATPAILTLRSGAAFALDSSEMCVLKDQSLAASNPPSVFTTDNTDIWLRKLVYCITLSDGSGGTFDVYNVDSTATSGWMPESCTVDIINPVSCSTTYSMVGGSGKMKDVSTNTQYTIVSGPSDCYVLYLVDSSGSIVGYGPAINGTSYITDSCWTSASPGAQLL